MKNSFKRKVLQWKQSDLPSNSYISYLILPSFDSTSPELSFSPQNGTLTPFWSFDTVIHNCRMNEWDERMLPFPPQELLKRRFTRADLHCFKANLWERSIHFRCDNKKHIARFFPSIFAKCLKFRPCCKLRLPQNYIKMQCIIFKLPFWYIIGGLRATVGHRKYSGIHWKK